VNLVNTTRTLNYIGANNSLGTFWNGELAELLVWSRALTTEETAAVGAYLYSRFQITTAQTTPPPVLSVSTGSFDGPTQVAIAADADSEIRVTTDGSTPTGASPLYSVPINCFFTRTVKANAVRNGISSSVVSATVTLNSTKWPAPDAGDSRPLNLNLQLPTVAIPQ
jgi:hypothetical protein